MLARGIAPEAIHMVRKEMERWADGFTHPAENVEDTVDELRMNPFDSERRTYSRSYLPS